MRLPAVCPKCGLITDCADEDERQCVCWWNEEEYIVPHATEPEFTPEQVASITSDKGESNEV